MVKESAKKGFVQGALVLMLFGLLSKIVGAIYRIPLTSIISAEGMGLYQIPPPCILFTHSSKRRFCLFPTDAIGSRSLCTGMSRHID